MTRNYPVDAAFVRGSEIVLDSEQRYLLALGKFVDVFAWVEEEMQTVLRHASGLAPRSFLAAFAGTRIDQGMNLVRRFSEATKFSSLQRKIIAKAFPQLALINNIRNDLLHYGVGMGSRRKRKVVTNARGVFRRGAVRRHPISVEILLDLQEDLITIFELLSTFPHVPDSRAWRLDVRAGLQGAWQYKPASQAPSRRRRSRKTSKPPKLQVPRRHLG